MIVIKIELWPHGIRDDAKEIGRMVIANDGTGNREYGNYTAALAPEANKPKGGCWKSGKVTNYLRSTPIYQLVSLCLKACLDGSDTEEGDKLINMTEKHRETPGEKQLRLIQEKILDYNPYAEQDIP